VLPTLAAELGPASADLAFIDAAKTEYPDYFRLLKPLIRPGGLLVADNVLGSGSWWIDTPPGDPDRDAVDRFNRIVAEDPDFEAAAVPIRQGVLIARKSR
jgi:caffeoyl-CoA O-methyltransferase